VFMHMDKRIIRFLIHKILQNAHSCIVKVQSVAPYYKLRDGSRPSAQARVWYGCCHIKKAKIRRFGGSQGMVPCFILHSKFMADVSMLYLLQLSLFTGSLAGRNSAFGDSGRHHQRAGGH
jgi:hypothetical protein